MAFARVAASTRPGHMCVSYSTTVQRPQMSLFGLKDRFKTSNTIFSYPHSKYDGQTGQIHLLNIEFGIRSTAVEIEVNKLSLT